MRIINISDVMAVFCIFMFVCLAVVAAQEQYNTTCVGEAIPCQKTCCKDSTFVCEKDMNNGDGQCYKSDTRVDCSDGLSYCYKPTTCCGVMGCCPSDSECCGLSTCCPKGAVCCSLNTCCPQGSTCCGFSNCCPRGSKCDGTICVRDRVGGNFPWYYVLCGMIPLIIIAIIVRRRLAMRRRAAMEGVVLMPSQPEPYPMNAGYDQPEAQMSRYADISSPKYEDIMRDRPT